MDNIPPLSKTMKFFNNYSVMPLFMSSIFAISEQPESWLKLWLSLKLSWPCTKPRMSINLGDTSFMIIPWLAMGYSSIHSRMKMEKLWCQASQAFALLQELTNRYGIGEVMSYLGNDGNNSKYSGGLVYSWILIEAKTQGLFKGDINHAKRRFFLVQGIRTKILG